jgi:acetoin utilization protein AcuA
MDTVRGRVTITSFCSPEEIGALSFAGAFAKHPHYNPIVSSKESLIRMAAEPDANVTIATADGDDIIGFGVLQYPESGERWGRVGDRAMMEVSVIEVSRPWRSLGLSGELLAMVLAHPRKEDRIFYMVGYSWTWDLDGSGLTTMDYREMMVRLFSGFGFNVLLTNEPNIMLRPENLFMARIGEHVSETTRKRLKMVRFNIE